MDKKIREYFHVKRGDNLPYTGWLQSTRADIYKFMASVGFTYGAEIGVRAGVNAKSMFLNMPGLKLICVDPWCAYGRVSDDKAQRIFARCQQRLKNFDVIYKKMYSLDAAREIPDRTLDFAYIDSLHDFDSVIMDIIAWIPKVKVGGIISGHDYFNSYQFGVVEAVRAYTFAHNIRDWHITTAEKEASWFWVNR